MSRIGYYNGVIYTADKENPAAEAFVVGDGRFVYVGSADGLTACDEKIDLQGKCVIPGLVDAHCHMFAGVVQAAMDMLFVPPETTPSQLGETIAALLAKEPCGRETVAVMGIDLTVGVFRAAHIDCVIPDRPVIVFSMDGHALLLNTKAMRLLGIDRDTPDPDKNSYYARDPGGNPTGLVIEIPAMRPCRKLLSEVRMEERKEILSDLAKAYASCGYTAIFEAMSVDDERTDDLDALVSLDRNGELPLRISASFLYEEALMQEPSRLVRRMERCREMLTSEHVFPDTLKIITDGTVEEHTALLFEPYADDPENCGLENNSPGAMKKAALLAAEKGFSVHMHAIGDKAVCRALDVLSSLGDIRGTKTIAHNQLYRREEIDKIIRAKDIFFQTTPHWMKNDEYTLLFLGQERFGRQFPVGTMQRNGVTVTFSSDSCLEEETANAFLGMYYACVRGDAAAAGDDCLPPESERITRMDSLLAYTINGARQLRMDHETGSITEGKSADFVVLDRDLMACPLHALGDTQVLETFFCGKKVYALS